MPTNAARQTTSRPLGAAVRVEPHRGPVIRPFVTFTDLSEARTRGVIVDVPSEGFHAMSDPAVARFVLVGHERLSSAARGKIVVIVRDPALAVAVFQYADGRCGGVACGNAWAAAGAHLLSDGGARAEFEAASGDGSFHVEVRRKGERFLQRVAFPNLAIEAIGNRVLVHGVNEYLFVRDEADLPETYEPRQRAALITDRGLVAFFGPNGLHGAQPTTGMGVLSVAAASGLRLPPHLHGVKGERLVLPDVTRNGPGWWVELPALGVRLGGVDHEDYV